ncbi:hypothetical protein ZWY2020_004978 [Hordeum vulgare]|nr:hypothetical protein ZWY2020_004978 [Hordeum vulgare]
MPQVTKRRDPIYGSVADTGDLTSPTSPWRIWQGHAARCRGRSAAGGEDEDGVGLAGGLEVAAEDGEVGEVVALRGGGARVRGDGGRCWAVERG